MSRNSSDALAVPHLLDSHFHIQPDDDLSALVKTANAAGVHPFLAVASDLDEARRLQTATAEFDNVHFTVGIHPHSASEKPPDLDAFRALLTHPRAIAVGEIGLDYHYTYSPRKRQLACFQAFLELAVELDMPVVVHCREAYADTHDAIAASGIPGHRVLVHSFTGTPEWAARFRDMGAYFSFNGIVTFKNADNVRAALSEIPDNRVLLETDAPYLTPVPHRGKRNQPACLVHIAERLAGEWGTATEDIARITTDNTRTFFDK